jgi:ATP-dependent DNA ligase
MTKLGTAEFAPIGSFDNQEIQGALSAYRRVVACAYIPIGPSDIERKLAIPLLVSTKIDGELWYLLNVDKKWQLVAPNGRVISGDCPILAEAEKAKLDPTAIFAGELYVEKEGRARIADLTSLLGAGAKADLSKLRYGIFDIVSSETVSALGTSYSVRYAALESIPAAGGLHRIGSEATSNVPQVEQLFTSIVEGGGAEGLVARSDDARTFKVKPTTEFDATIIGFTEKREADGSSVIRTILLGLQKDDGSWIPVAATGNFGDASFKKDLLAQLKASVRPSSYRRTSESSGIMYQFVEPKIVVELRAVDIQIEDLHGEVIRDPRLVLEAAGWKVGGWTNSANVHNAVLVRVRTDKAANSTDSGWNQITRLFPIQEGEKEIELGTSEIIRREVWTKEGAGKTDVRKLLVWKTNKEAAGYPAFVVNWTDYASGRKAPLAREVRLAPNKAEAEKIAEAMIAENVKKGWNKV